MGIFSKSNKVSALILEQIKDVEGCLINFENFMRAAVTPGTATETLRALSVGVHQMENAADRSLRVMIESLANGSYLPSTREDLISIASKCDKVANKCQHTAMLFIVERFFFSEKYGKDVLEIMSITRDQHCEPKKISVRKTPKPQRFRGFVMPFFKVKSKRYHSPKPTFGQNLN